MNPKPTWSKVKELVAQQKLSDPQRGTLSERAIVAVEDGLRHLESVGWVFEIVPRGTLVSLLERDPPTRTLSLNEASEQMTAPAKPVDDRFEAGKIH